MIKRNCSIEQGSLNVVPDPMRTVCSLAFGESNTLPTWTWHTRGIGMLLFGLFAQFASSVFSLWCCSKL